MADHLPECTDDLRWMLNPGEWVDEDTGEAECVLCCMLLACERRVRQEERTLVAVERTTLAELNAEYRKGVQAAREAVAGVGASMTRVNDVVVLAHINRDTALAAIDALRSDASVVVSGYRDIETPPYDGAWHRDLFGDADA